MQGYTVILLYFIMVRFCCICKAEYGVRSDVSFHCIPKKDELREKWINIIGRQVAKSSSVCSDHFTDTDFQYKIIKNVPKRYLVPDAVPSLLHPIRQTMLLTSNESLHGKNIEQAIDNSDTDDKYTTEVNSKQSVVPSPAGLSETILCNDSNDEYLTSEINSRQSAVPTPAALIETIISSDTDDEYSTSEVNSKQSAVSNPAILINEDSQSNEDFSLKRKNKKLVNPTAKRFCYPRFIGDFRREDFTSRESWEVLEKFLNLNKTKISTLTKKVTRLQRKVESMKDLLSHLKEYCVERSSKLFREGKNETLLEQTKHEIQQLRWELSRRNAERDALNSELATLTLKIEDLINEVTEAQALNESLADNKTQTRYDALLQMYGDKEEENQELT